jgi:peptidoglycan/LPS O-acetylase OafA/YrhL
MFVIQRIVRIWPAHLIVLAGFAAVALTAGTLGIIPRHQSDFLWSALPAQVMLAQCWGIPGGEGWNFASWSLSALIVCYVAFPVLWRAQSRFQSASRLLAFALLVVIQIDLICRVWLHHSLFDAPFKLGAIRALPLFMLGMALSRLVQDVTLTRRTYDLLLGFAGLTLVALQVAGRFDLPSIAMIAVIIFAAGGRPILRPSGLLERGAALSFSLFVTHTLAAILWFRMTRALPFDGWLSLQARWTVWGLAFVFALLVAWLFDRYVDGPVQAWLRPRVSLRRVPRPEPGPSGSGHRPR